MPTISGTGPYPELVPVAGFMYPGQDRARGPVPQGRLLKIQYAGFSDIFQRHGVGAEVAPIARTADPAEVCADALYG